MTDESKPNWAKGIRTSCLVRNSITNLKGFPKHRQTHICYVSRAETLFKEAYSHKKYLIAECNNFMVCCFFA